jgi:flagellar motor switch/type III secretory pathway protein FliN
MTDDAERLKPANIAMMGGSLMSGAVSGGKQIASIATLRGFQDINMEMICEIGRVDITIGQLLKLQRGAFIDLSDEVVDEIKMYVNDKLAAYGEPISARSNYGVKISRLELRPEIEDES